MNETSAHPAVDATAPPPEPAKPQHVKREAGQRWRSAEGGDATLLKRSDCGKGWETNDSREPYWSDFRWTKWASEHRMTLLAPAPAAIPAAPKVERAGPPAGYERCPLNCGNWYSACDLFGVFRGCNRCFIFTNGMAPGRLAELERQFGPDWTPPLSAPKAIEAAKPATVAPATPKCGNNGCKTPYQNVAQRWCTRLNEYAKVGADLEWSCEPCHLLDEAEFTQGMSFETTGESNVLSNPDVPALIDRRLSHVANCHDDDLVGP